MTAKSLNYLKDASKKNLKSNPDKFKQKSVKYLGHLITAKGLQPEPSKV